MSLIIEKLKRPVLAVFMLAVLFAPALPITSASATSTTPSIAGSVCYGTKNLQLSTGDQDESNCSGNSELNTDSFNNLIKKIVNIFSVIVGIIAVIMIIVGGLKYITSGGESGKIGSAKNTILFALVGLIIVALAQVIVHFVLGHATNLGTSS